ncbi:hypothetical protein GCM10028803_18000 [Larkinella knui]|uniref:Nucleotide-diphospho-sugar transferase domain-containing protein n=1 Tax=Larkinella knui TaxID=2025310 RepID=A0A3P1CUY5_9BACT|nr:hypothetical protein [Larkinella knui]RRB16910.1 hypothetical protein EHT87_01060 [Larkinella knui]
MIPLVFIHSGYQSYLEYSLRQCKLANPESAVFLLGDDANKNRFPFVTHVPITALNAEQSDEFTRLYVHRSTNPHWYELLCLVRWFYVQAFMEEWQLDAVFVADSDVMLYKNCSRYAAWAHRNDRQQSAYCRADYQTTNPYSWLASAHSSYWSRPGIRDFCQYLLHTYQTPANQSRLEEKWQYHQKNALAGGVSDMALLYLYADDYPDRVINLLQPSAETSQSLPEVFDLNISIANNRLENEYELDSRQLKKVAWNQHQYVGFNRILNQNCLFNSLHFQGLSKRYIHRYYQGTDLRLHRLGQEVAHRFSPVLKPVYRLKNGLKRILNS